VPPILLQVSGRCFQPAATWLVGAGMVCLLYATDLAQQETRPRRVRPPVSSSQPVPVSQPDFTSPAASPSALSRDQREKRLIAAREFVVATGLPTICVRKLLDAFEEYLRKKPPKYQAQADIFMDFIEQCAGDEALSEEIAAYLARNFEEQELLQLKAIAKTSAGRKIFYRFDNLPQAERLSDPDYLRLFDEQELKQFETFLRIPAFQKFSVRSAMLLGISAEIITGKLESNRDELFRQMLDEMYRYQKEQPLPRD
jgi:hypothetical protein